MVIGLTKNSNTQNPVPGSRALLGKKAEASGVFGNEDVRLGAY